MNEHPDHGEHPVTETTPTVPHEQESPAEPTGHAAVDEVLRTMSGLRERPVEEHVAIFEAAHEKLRTALSEANERPGDSAGS